MQRTQEPSSGKPHVPTWLLLGPLPWQALCLPTPTLEGRPVPPAGQAPMCLCLWIIFFTVLCPLPGIPHIHFRFLPLGSNPWALGPMHPTLLSSCTHHVFIFSDPSSWCGPTSLWLPCPNKNNGPCSVKPWRMDSLDQESVTKLSPHT